MNEELKELLKESIKLERNVARLYLLFSELFNQDYEFWWNLHNEENNHAILLRSVLDLFIQFNQYPKELICHSLEELQTTNKGLEDTYKNFRKHPPDRETAFKTAIKMESSAGELHFQDFMKKTSSDEIDNIFRKLNLEDKDHYNRIKAYMKQTS